MFVVGMVKVNWREIFKFLSGFSAAGFLTNLYLYLNNISLPFLGYTLPPELFGVRFIVNFILFGVFFQEGLLKNEIVAYATSV